MYALVDCNNFFVSCERVFNPHLNGKAVVVLSNNDGCIVARSKEAKDLGIPMGAPLFEYEKMMANHGVIICSSNFILYHDMSQRVMQTLGPFSPDIEKYSIDEAFLLCDPQDPIAFGKQMRERVLQWTGIPVSIGFAPTKTLAKAANYHAKKCPQFQGVFNLKDQAAITQFLQLFPVEEIWGIGRRLSEKLRQKGIWSAAAFRDCDDNWIRKEMGVVGLRIAWELRGIPCLNLQEVNPPKKSIISSRAFGKTVDQWDDLAEAVASHAARVAEKARAQGSLASAISVFIEQHPFRSAPTLFGQIILPEATAYTPQLIHYAKQIAQRLFHPSMQYRKAGVMIEGLVSQNAFQPDLFTIQRPSHKKQKDSMQTLDAINKRSNQRLLYFAAEGIQKSWKMKQSLCSPHYTTSWKELLHVK